MKPIWKYIYIYTCAEISRNIYKHIDIDSNKYTQIRKYIETCGNMKTLTIVELYGKNDKISQSTISNLQKI